MILVFNLIIQKLSYQIEDKNLKTLIRLIDKYILW